MKHFKQFFVFALLALFSVGAWGAEYTATYTVSSASEVNGTGDIPTGATATLTGNAGLNNGMLQLTYGKNAVLTLAGYEGCTITGFKMSMKSNSSKGKGSMTLVAGATTLHSVPDANFNSSDWYGSWSTTAVDVDFTSAMTTDYTVGENEDIVITVTNHGTSNSTNSLYIGSYTIIYEVSGGGSTPSLSAAPTTIDFGTVEVGASVDDETVAVTFANLTGSVTYSGLAAPFSATGSVSATGDEITISADATNAGTFEQTLTIESTADSKSTTVTVKMKVAAPTGTFELYSGDITEGDYVLVSTNALSNTVNNNRLASQAVTISDDKIVNPDAAIIWHIAPVSETSYWTVYNEDASKYAGGTTTKNQGALLADITDYAKWTIAEGAGVYEFENLGRATGGSDTGNKWLRYNSGNAENSRWACYGSGTGSAPTLYKKSNGKAAAGLAYDAADAQKLAKIGGDLTAPTLTNPNGLTLAYASSNTDVVEVNASTGAITAIKAAGKAVITASTEGDATHNPGSASYTIFVAEQAGTDADPLTEASAKALIDNGCTLNVNVKGTVVTVGSLNTTYGSISLTLTDGFQFYGMLNTSGAQFTENPFVVGDVVTAVGNLKKHNSTYELDLNCQLVERIPFAGSKTSIANTKETAYTVAQALAYAADPTTYDLTDHVYIAGVVYQVNSFNSTNGTYNIYIKDAGTSEDDGKFEFFKCSGLYEVGGTPAQFAEGDVQIGDEVIGYGVMTYYSGGNIWEFGQPNQLVSLNRPAVPTYSITYEENGGSAVDDATDQTNLPDPLPTTTKADKAFGGWYTTSTFDPGTEAVAGAALTDDVTLYAKWVDVSIWALTYSSNVTVGTDKVVINTVEYAAKKTGTSSAFGSTTIEVPTGATTLHFHAAGWGADAVVNLEVKKGETLLNTFALTKDAGVKSNSPFTLEGTPYLQYYSVALSEITEPTTITFEAKNDGGKRFVLYGVNQEGGTVPATIAANPASIGFGSVEQNASVAAKTINVTLTNVAAATVTLAGDDAFSIDQTSLTENGTITVTPNTTTVGTYAATVTISDDANAADDVVVNVSMTVTEPEVNDDVTGTWTLVTDAATLAVGKKVIIAQYVDADGEIYTMGKQNTNNRAQVESTVAGATLNPATGTKVLTLVDAGEGKFAIQASNGNYLSAAGTGTSNHLKEAANYDNDNEKWTITIASDQAKIQAASSNRNTIRYNSGSSIFSCYAEDGQAAVALYMLEETTPPTPDYTEVRTSLEIGRHYTICMPKNITEVRGGTFWSMSERNTAGDLAYLVEEAAPFDAGKPYIFKATAATLEVVYGDENAATPVDNGALRGTFDYMSGADLEAQGNVYLLISNTLVPLDPSNWLNANRAYVDYDALTAVSEPSHAPGRRVVAMPMHKDVTTGMDELNASETPVKVLINGQLFILRGEKMYNANGQLVK